MEDSKPTQAQPLPARIAGNLELFSARLIERVTAGLSQALADALEVSGLTRRVQDLSERLAALDASPTPAKAGSDQTTASSEPSEGQRHTCKEPGCGLPARARGLCSKHYQRLRYAEKRAQEVGEPPPKDLTEARSRRSRKPARKTAKRGGSTCSQPDCQRPTYAKGMCGKHFMEWVRGQKELKAQTETDPEDGSE